MQFPGPHPSCLDETSLGVWPRNLHHQQAPKETWCSRDCSTSQPQQTGWGWGGTSLSLKAMSTFSGSQRSLLSGCASSALPSFSCSL